MKRLAYLLGILALAIIAYCFSPRIRAAVSTVMQPLRVPKTVAQRLEQYGERTRHRWAGYFEKAGVPYPPAQVVLAGFKEERRLEVYAGAPDRPLRFVRACPILAASGEAGPKLREGDGQVPEGIYAIESLNPNSRFHLSLRINYPNTFDREQALKDGRTRLGGDIMIHGSSVSVGCLAMGDEVAEDLFVLAADTGLTNLSVILSPVDFRNRKPPSASTNQPGWIPSLYEQIRTRLTALPRP